MTLDRSAASETPPAVTRYVIALALIAAAGVGASLAAVAPDVASLGHSTLPTLLVVGLFVLFHYYPFTFYWRDNRLVVTMDETIMLIGLLLVPPPLLILVVLVANVITQSWIGPAARIKRAFNVAQYVVTGMVAVALYLGLTSVGVPPILAATGAGLAFGMLANLLLAGVFARISNVSTLAVYRERFMVQGTAAGVVGASSGILLVALWTFHPLAMLAAAPFAYLVRRYYRLHAVADRELEVHRRLANVTQDLVGSPSIPDVGERVLSECEALLDCGRAIIVVDTAQENYMLDRTYGSGPQRLAPSLMEPLPAHAGGVLGRLEVWPRQGKSPFGQQERELLRTIAGQAASAVENAQAIAAADAARRRLDAYLSTAQDAVLLAHRDGRIRYANPAASRLFLDGGDVDGCTAADLFDDPRLALREGRMPSAPLLVEASARTRAGDRKFLVEAHVGPLMEGGRVTGLLMVVRDVTERKRLEDEMVRQREALAQNEKLSALGTLVAGVAHEINNPLTYMRGNLQLTAESVALRLEDPSLPDADRAFLAEVAESAKVALEGVDRIREIASSLKNVAKKGTGQERPEDLNRLVHEVLSVVRAGLPRTVRLELDLAPDLPLVPAKASEVHQILLNLVKNSVEALDGRDDGLVCVRSWADDEAVHLEVADNGCGIPAEVQRSLFSPFFTTKASGTGLGLNISRSIAQAHGGELSLQSDVGVGTTFVLTLPRQRAGDDATADASAAAVGA